MVWVAGNRGGTVYVMYIFYGEIRGREGFRH